MPENSEEMLLCEYLSRKYWDSIEKFLLLPLLFSATRHLIRAETYTREFKIIALIRAQGQLP